MERSRQRTHNRSQLWDLTPISESIARQHDNVTDESAYAPQCASSRPQTPELMNFYTLVGKSDGVPLDLSLFATNADYSLDSNRTSKNAFSFCGAYAGTGTSPGWQLQAGIKPQP